GGARVPHRDAKHADVLASGKVACSPSSPRPLRRTARQAPGGTLRSLRLRAAPRALLPFAARVSTGGVRSMGGGCLRRGLRGSGGASGGGGPPPHVHAVLPLNVSETRSCAPHHGDRRRMSCVPSTSSPDPFTRAPRRTWASPRSFPAAGWRA